MKDTIAGLPYEVKKEDSMTVITFYPKSKNAKHPDVGILKIKATKDDLKKLVKIAS